MGSEIEIEIPVFIELKESNIFANDLGAFSRDVIPASKFIGTFDGKTRNTLQSNEDLTYIWAVVIIFILKIIFCTFSKRF